MGTATFLVVSADHSDPARHEGLDRLDRWLVGRLPGQSRSTIQRWIKEGSVYVNEKEARANFRLTIGDVIRVELPDSPRPTESLPEAIPLDVVYEDSDILVVNKPSGLVVHPAPGHREGTLVNAVLNHVPDLVGISGEIRPGIVHRLDKDTSGVMVVAKNEASLRNLQAQFKSRKVIKRYTALVEGTLTKDNGRIDAPIGRDPRNRKRMAVILGDSSNALSARSAITDYEVLARYSIPLKNDLGRGSFSLVNIHPLTGRTHQIRVHFAWLGHPLVGDPIYGLKHQRLPSPRLFLHAQSLSFSLPSTEKWMDFSAPLPDDLQRLLDTYLLPTT